MYPLDLQYRDSVMNKKYPPSNGGYSFTPIEKNDEIIFCSGNKACVYKVTSDSDGSIKALKLFSSEQKDRFNRFKHIATTLSKHRSAHIVSFDFIERLIFVSVENQDIEENYFPGLVMDWAEGVTLGTKIKELCQSNNISSLNKILNNFKSLSLFLLNNNIGHGDLKHDNIIVNNKLELILVDYDGMYVPSLKGKKSIEIGTESFQHPLRSENDFNERIDDFSILTIYTSLKALCIQPQLFEQFNDQQNLLFSKEDFMNPKISKLFSILSNLLETKALIHFIKKSLASKSIYIDNVEDLLKSNFPKPTIKVTHYPSSPVVGEEVLFNWQTENVSFVKINGKSQILSGSFREVITENHSVLFEYGNEYDSSGKLKYPVKTKKPPEIISFSAKNTELKFNENAILSWEAKHFSSAFLHYGLKKVEVTKVSRHEIKGLSRDTEITLLLYSSKNDFKVEKKIYIEVYHPVTLNVEQERRITYPNRPVKIYITSQNAQSVILRPSNIDITGKRTYIITTDHDIQVQVHAANKKYSISKSLSIEVLKIPSRPDNLIKLPDVRISLPSPIFSRFNHESLKKISCLNPLKTRLDIFLKKMNNIKLSK